MLVNVKTLNDKYWYKFPRFLQMILETMYPKLPVTMKTYDVKINNHMVFSMLNQKSRENVGIKYQNKKPLENFGVFSEIREEVPTQINATVADEHDVEIIEAPPGSNELVENVDLTGIKSEEDEADDKMADDNEVSENISEGKTETELNAESLIAETQNVEEPVNVSPPHDEPVATPTVDAEDAQEDPTANLPPRKRSRRDPRINGEDNTEVRTTTESTTPVTTTRPPIHYMLSELSPTIIDFLQNERASMYIHVLKPREGSSSGPSDADVVRAADSSDSDDLLEEDETTILMHRITVLDEDKIFKDAQISSLMEELVCCCDGYEAKA
ncbi:hypothetical protein HanPI659440_Chr09g0349351 [Helianthus annuus]|nr:hypothetical protein HanPI659440_Chr09g0349351 [Helianthus annuus]